MTTPESKEVHFIDYLLILAKWRKLLAGNFVVVGVLAVSLSLILPKYYKAGVVFLPPSQSRGLSALIQNLSLDILDSSDITGEACLTILKSRELRQHLIEKYDLMTLYEEDYLEHTLKELEKNVIIEPEYQVGIGVSTISSITLSVIDKDPKRAADIANDFLRLLEERIIELNTQKAKNNREFLERRVAQNRVDLDAAEDSLRAFQEEFGTIEISTQSKASIEAAAELKAQILALEIERQILEKSFLPGSAELRQINIRMEAMQKEYSRFYYDTGNSRSGQEVLLPIGKIPSLALKYFRAKREAEVQNKLYEMLVPLYEQAKIQESKTIPVLKIIDHATPPTYKDRPKRLLIVLGVLTVSSIFCLLYIFYREFVANLRENNLAQYAKFVALSRALSIRDNDRVLR